MTYPDETPEARLARVQAYRPSAITDPWTAGRILAERMQCCACPQEVQNAISYLLDPPEEPSIVYIAHPLVGDGSEEWGNRERNLERYRRLMERAYREGHVVLTWIHHVALDAGGIEADWLALDLRLLSLLVGHPRALLWLPCPRGVSKGVDTEVAFAEAHGIRVVEVEL